MALHNIDEGNGVSIKQFMDCIDYRITSGYDYLWKSFGHDCYSITSEDAEYEKYSTSIVFSRKTHVVFMMEVWDYEKRKTYQWVHPEYREAYKEECKKHNVAYNTDEDGNKIINLETSFDIIDKTKKIIAGEAYDERVQVPITLPDEELFRLMLYAHENDMTLNQYVENILRHIIDQDVFNSRNK